MLFRERLVVSIRHFKRLHRAIQRPEQLTDYPLVSSEKLRFADTDRNGHVSNAVFAVCCQNARMELLTDAGLTPVPPGAQFVLGRLDLTFRREMHWPGTVQVGTRVARVEGSTVHLAQALFVEDRCVAIAKSAVVLINMDTRRPESLSFELAAHLTEFSGPGTRNNDLLLRARRAIETWPVRA
ncbi:MAG: acyl-CoA thioesterase [Alphaproteobacteria bacterium]|nr:acyl-CoA thioesterase [Alphaproteobacteria bacterium]